MSSPPPGSLCPANTMDGVGYMGVEIGKRGRLGCSHGSRPGRSSQGPEPACPQAEPSSLRPLQARQPSHDENTVRHSLGPPTFSMSLATKSGGYRLWG